jgi:hypothetical protein
VKLLSHFLCGISFFFFLFSAYKAQHTHTHNIYITTNKTTPNEVNVKYAALKSLSLVHSYLFLSHALFVHEPHSSLLSSSPTQADSGGGTLTNKVGPGKDQKTILETKEEK